MTESNQASIVLLITKGVVTVNRVAKRTLLYVILNKCEGVLNFNLLGRLSYCSIFDKEHLFQAV